MKISKLLLGVWVCWVVSTLFFAYVTYGAPADVGSMNPTAPEFFLFVLGLCHLVAGIVLLIGVFIHDNKETW